MAERLNNECSPSSISRWLNLHERYRPAIHLAGNWSCSPSNMHVGRPPKYTVWHGSARVHFVQLPTPVSPIWIIVIAGGRGRAAVWWRIKQHDAGDSRLRCTMHYTCWAVAQLCQRLPFHCQPWQQLAAIDDLKDSVSDMGVLKQIIRTCRLPGTGNQSKHMEISQPHGSSIIHLTTFRQALQ